MSSYKHTKAESRLSAGRCSSPLRENEKQCIDSEKFNLAVLISGSGSNLQAIMDAADNGTIPNSAVALVISNREGAFGLERAKKRGIPNIVINNQDTTALLTALVNSKVDGIILAGYLSIISPIVVKTYKNRIINIHPALLPLFGGKGFYGIRVHEAALKSGAPYTGATAHLVDCGVDTGDVLVRGVVPVLADDTAESLQKRVLEIEHKVLVRAVKALVEGEVETMVKKPITLVSDSDKEGLLKYANGLLKLGNTLLCNALTETDNGEI